MSLQTGYSFEISTRRVYRRVGQNGNYDGEELLITSRTPKVCAKNFQQKCHFIIITAAI